VSYPLRKTEPLPIPLTPQPSIGYLMPFLACPFIRLRAKMYSSYESWKQSRDSRGAPTRSVQAPGSTSGRIATIPPKESPPTDGVYSYNQYKRLERATSVKPPSRVGSVRSYQSVLTVEEQVNALEAKVDEMLRAQEEAKRREAQTRELLTAILHKLEPPSSTTDKGKGKEEAKR